jgi:hypothetical protein
MATQPTALEIRTFQVGFGDCFLLSFAYPKGKRHVLIDFGSTGITERKKKGTTAKAKNAPSQAAHMRKIADEISAVCGKDAARAPAVDGGS